MVYWPVFRVRKQHAVEDKLEKLLADIKGFSTGGESYFSYKVDREIRRNVISLIPIKFGQYPIKDVFINVTTKNTERNIITFTSITDVNIHIATLLAYMTDTNINYLQTDIVCLASNYSSLQAIEHTRKNDGAIHVKSTLYVTHVKNTKGKIEPIIEEYDVPAF